MTDEPMFSFSLVVKGGLTDEIVEMLYESCADFAIQIDRDGAGGLIEVDRAGMSCLSAVLESISQVESFDNLTVTRVEPDDLVYASEIAERTGRTRGSIDQLVNGTRGPGDFPDPVTHAGARNPLWRWSEVAEWMANHEGREIPDRDREQTLSIGAVNGALETRRFTRKLPQEEREEIQRLLA